MVQKRSEGDKITQSPILVKFGGKEYEIYPLVIRESKLWRKEFAEVLRGLPLFVNAVDTTENFERVINGMFLDVPDKVMDLIFSYAKNLPRKEIEAVATDQEMADAFSAIIEMAFPLARSMVGMPGMLSQSQ